MTADPSAGPQSGIPEPWTPEREEEFKAEFARLTGDPSLRHHVRFLPPGLPEVPVTHIAGSEVQVGSHLRQRCAWCGEVMADYGLECIAVPDGQDPRPAMWAQGALVRRDGSAWFVGDHEEGADLPADSCAVAEIDAPKEM